MASSPACKEKHASLSISVAAIAPACGTGKGPMTGSPRCCSRVSISTGCCSSTILNGPEHPDYAAFCPAPGHGLGINDLKVIEARNFIQSIATNEPVYSDFRNGYHIQKVIDAIEISNERQEWIDVSN